MKLLVIHGPNLNMLGIREKKIYGAETYEDLLEYIRQICAREGIEVKFYQSNHEGDLVDAIQGAYFDRMDGIIINPGAYTHTSIALLDAVKAVQVPTVEVHLSDIYEREEFRHVSYISLGCIHSYYGMGFQGYGEAVNCLKEHWKKTAAQTQSPGGGTECPPEREG